ACERGFSPHYGDRPRSPSRSAPPRRLLRRFRRKDMLRMRPWRRVPRARLRPLGARRGADRKSRGRRHGCRNSEHEVAALQLRHTIRREPGELRHGPRSIQTAGPLRPRARCIPPPAALFFFLIKQWLGAGFVFVLQNAAANSGREGRATTKILTSTKCALEVTPSK